MSETANGGSAGSGATQPTGSNKDVGLVKMGRATPLHPGGPTEADVPRSEVANFEAAGWKVEKAEERPVACEAKPKAPQPKPRARQGDNQGAQ